MSDPTESIRRHLEEIDRMVRAKTMPVQNEIDYINRLFQDGVNAEKAVRAGLPSLGKMEWLYSEQALGITDSMKQTKGMAEFITEQLREKGNFAPDLLFKGLDIGEQIQAYQDRFRDLNKTFYAGTKSSLEDIMSIAKSSATASMTSISSIGRALSEPYNLGDSWEKLRDIAAQWDNPIFSADSYLKLQRDSIEPLLKAQADWQRIFQLPSSVAEIAKINALATGLLDQISASISRPQYASAESGLGDDDQDRQQAIELANTRLSSAFSENKPSSALRVLGDFLAELKDGAIRLTPKLKHTLLLILVHLVAGLLADALEVTFRSRNEEPPKVVRHVEREARRIQRSVPAIPENIRVVVASQLIVHISPRQASTALGRFYAGDLVIVREKRTRSWALVEYTSAEDDIVLRGWVFSRYLKPLSGGALRQR